jgi:hypothetical protein
MDIKFLTDDVFILERSLYVEYVRMRAALISSYNRRRE